MNSQLEIVADWRKQHDTGIIHYRRDNKVRGLMMCNVWDKVDAARQMILRGAGGDERLLQQPVRPLLLRQAAEARR